MYRFLFRLLAVALLVGFTILGMRLDSVRVPHVHVRTFTAAFSK